MEKFSTLSAIAVPLDEVNESNKTAERIDAWTAEIKSKL